MASDASHDFAFLAAAARRTIDDLRRAARTAPSVEGQRGAHFLAVVEETLSALDAGVDARERDFAAAFDASERESVIRALRLLNHHVRRFHEATPWIESTRVSDLGLGLTYFVDEIARALLRQPADIVMSPSAEYMYSTLHKPLEPALTALGSAYPTSVPDVVVAYPAQEPDSLFLHLIVAHELGHSAIAEHNLVSQVYARDSDIPATQASLNDAVREHINVEGSQPQEAIALVRLMLRNWLTELICDGLALGYLGPSFVFTYAAFMTPFGGPVPSPTHPPNTLRTRLLVERIDSWGWRGPLETSVPKTFEWIETAGKAPQEPGHRTYFFRLEEAILRLSATLEAVLADHLGASRFDPVAYAETAPQLHDLLALDVLPSQLLDRSAADRRSIVLAAWLHEFERHGDEPVSLIRIIANRSYQRFLTKALEMSAVLERWGAL